MSWRWRRRRNQSFGFWENREGERVGPIPLDEHGRAAFVPASDDRASVERAQAWGYVQIAKLILMGDADREPEKFLGTVKAICQQAAERGA